MSDPAQKIVCCSSCEGFGWNEDEFSGEAENCDWCAGVGYVYRDGAGRDYAIPKADFTAVAAELEELELERLREMGYQGRAKKPWQQAIRKDTSLGVDPYEPNEG